MGVEIVSMRKMSDRFLRRRFARCKVLGRFAGICVGDVVGRRKRVGRRGRGKDE
jgi:hypothetical protein